MIGFMRVRLLVGSLLMAAAVTGGCSSATTPKIALAPQPWRTIHPTDNARVMLIDIDQGTRNPRDPCWVHSATRTQLRNEAFYITLRVGMPSLPPHTFCALPGVSGPFYATVNLPAPYHGQPLIDAVSGQSRAPGAVIRLSDAPKRFR